MQLREYIEHFSQTQNLPIKDRIEIGRTNLFDFDYPIFDTNYKKVFETHFIRHFYMREIGFETEGLFKFQLENWLIINMPYFNKMFESELIQFDPLSNTKTDTTHTKSNSGTASSESNSESHANGTKTDDDFTRNIESTTPNDRLSITSNDGEGLIEYASSIDEHNANNKQDVVSNNTANDLSNSEMNSVEEYVSHKVGKIGVQSFSKMLTEYRGTLIRIEKELFKEMNELFMLVY